MDFTRWRNDEFTNINNKSYISKSHRKVVKRYYVDKLCGRETRHELQAMVGGAIEHLLECGDQWRNCLLNFKEITNDSGRRWLASDVGSM